MCQYGPCDGTAYWIVTSHESGDDISVCESHLHIGDNPRLISS